MLRLIFAMIGLFAATPTVSQDTVTVTLTKFHFTPNALTFHHGHAYTLRIVNMASGGHNFVAPEFFSASAMSPADRAKVPEGKVDLSGGQSAEVHLTAPARLGSYKLKCSHLLHSSLGMAGTITVD